MLKAVLFDFDGTLFSSERPRFEALRLALGAYGIGITFEEYIHEYIGYSMPDAANIIVARYGLPISPDRFAKEREDIYLKWMASNTPEPFPYAEDILNYLLKYGIDMAVVSGSHRSAVVEALERNSFNYYFRAIITLEDCLRAKPSLDLYLYALSALGIDADYSLAVEDSINGWKAAKAAGIRCIHIAHSGEGQRIPGAESIGGFRELQSLITNEYGIGACQNT